jgi:hypothetical protein
MPRVICAIGFSVLLAACVSKVPPTDAKEFASWCQRQRKVVKYTEVSDATYTREFGPKATPAESQ